jgi:hypothetical protein
MSHDPLELLQEQMKSKLVEKVDEVMDKARLDLIQLDAFIDYAVSVDDPVLAERVSKACAWLSRAMESRSISLRLIETNAAGATVAAEGVAQAAIAAARVGL